MNNTELMKLLKRVNQNHLQRKYLFLMGGVIVATSIGLFVLYKKNKKMSVDLSTLNDLNNRLTIKTNEQQGAILQNEEQIKELVNENQALQRTLVAKQTQSSIPEITS